MSTTPQEPDPPEIRLVLRAGIVALSRVLDREHVDAEDLARLAAYVRALKRLREHLEGRDDDG